MRRAVVAAAAIALIAAAGVLARSLAGPDPQVRAIADGCERNDAAMLQGLAPNWVRVFDGNAAASAPPPPMQTLQGVVNSNGKPWYSPHVSGGDTPYSHAGYDLNMDVKLDPQYANLIGVGNDATAGTESGELGRLHTEREAETVPYFVWPEAGDRVWIKGFWIWDCDHYQPAGERTEIHPIQALWVQRTWSPNSATGEAEADLYLTTDKTDAGKQADCAHKTKHDQTAFKACLRTEPNYVDMSGTYKLGITLPPSTRGGKKVVRVVDMGSVNKPRILVGTKGGPADQAGIAFRVPTDGKRHVVALRVFAGWANDRNRPRRFRVDVTKVLVRRAMDPACLPQKAPPCGTPETTHEDQVSRGPDGEWNFYWDVGGKWSLWKPTVFKVRDGQTIRPRVSTEVWVPRSRLFRVFVWTRECDWGTLALGGSGALTPCPKQPEVGVRAGDDVPGGALATFTGPGTKTLVPQWGIGSCPRAANPRGCYAVTVRVRRVG